MRLISTLCLMLAFVLAGNAHAHIGEKIYLIFEISDADLEDINLFDADISDWEDVVGDASLTPEDFFADPTVGEGAQYNPADMDYRLWLGWNETNNRLYLATERIDDVYINEYGGGAPATVWQYDSVELMVDGDHSGGQYNFNNSEDMTDAEKATQPKRSGSEVECYLRRARRAHSGVSGPSRVAQLNTAERRRRRIGRRRANRVSPRDLRHALRRHYLRRSRE